jgi:hypothetical protein
MMRAPVVLTGAVKIVDLVLTDRDSRRKSPSASERYLLTTEERMPIMQITINVRKATRSGSPKSPMSIGYRIATVYAHSPGTTRITRENVNGIHKIVPQIRSTRPNTRQ